MKIALFIPSLRGGGAERMFIRMATHFVACGHSADMVLMNATNIEYRGELSKDVRVVDLNTPRLWTSLPPFCHYLRREKPDAVISAMPLANAIAAWGARLTPGAPVTILTEHNAVSLAFGDLDTPRYRPLMWAIRPSYRFADAAVGVSRGVADRLRRMLSMKPERIHVIYNPAWSPEMETQAQEPASINGFTEPDMPVLITAGRMEAQKDFGTLLKAFAVLRQTRPARLVILGEGSLRGELETLADTLGIANDVSMPGFVENPFACFAKASVFVLSSIHEGFGNVLVEAMACGTQVVSTACPSGPSEILDDGRYGPLVPVGDYQALAAAIKQQLDYPTPADTLRARAREFSVEVSAGAYLALLERLLEEKSERQA